MADFGSMNRWSVTVRSRWRPAVVAFHAVVRPRRPAWVWYRSRGHTQAREEPCLHHQPEGKNADEDEPIHASVLRAYL